MLNKAVIDLNLLRKNAILIKSKLNKGVLFNAVVKADAYGHGINKIANALYGIADCFSVATVEEGKSLRLSGIDKQILVLIPLLNEDVHHAVRHDFTVTVDSFDTILALERECERQNKHLNVHLKYNSGMNRFGVDTLEGLNLMAQKITKSKWLYLDGMFSHLSAPENKKSLINAQNKFLLANNLIKGYNKRAKCHLSASGGFLMGVQFDMVRIGLLLYGYKPFESDLLKVNRVMKVYAPKLKSRSLYKGENLLYGNYALSKNQDISLVRYGYADGLFRSKTPAQFNNRCMDVSALPFSQKDWVLVMENADVLAKQYKTISYEILTKCAFKAQKIYLN